VSIWCSFAIFDEDAFEDGFSEPFVYQRSHVMPQLNGPRGGALDFGYIPGYVRQDWDEHDPRNDQCYRWLRVSLEADMNTIVLDVDQVDALIRELTVWRDRVNKDFD
jgi:hypothetical protein